MKQISLVVFAILIGLAASQRSTLRDILERLERRQEQLRNLIDRRSTLGLDTLPGVRPWAPWQPWSPWSWNFPPNRRPRPPFCDSSNSGSEESVTESSSDESESSSEAASDESDSSSSDDSSDDSSSSESDSNESDSSSSDFSEE